MKGIVLAGGSGSRLRPTTYVVGKALHLVYNKPMVWYPFQTLYDAGVNEILIITTPQDADRVREIMNYYPFDPDRKGYVEVAIQQRPRGIADAFNIGGRYFPEDESVALILGDNIFHGDFGFQQDLEDFHKHMGALIYGYQHLKVGEFGVLELGKDGQVLSIEEKPKTPKSDMMVPGLI